jgi:hypothetical protein
MTIPARTVEQRDAALRAAREVRSVRAALREQIRSGEIEASHVLDGAQTNDVWAALRVDWLIASVPGMGEVKVAALMNRLGISPSRRVRGLGVHQRAALLDEFRDLSRRRSVNHA